MAQSRTNAIPSVGVLAQQVLSTREQLSDTTNRISNAFAILKRPSPSVIEQGVNALVLIDSPPVTTQSFTRAMAMLEANYGTEYNSEKAALLFDVVREEGWSEERFLRTLKWFLKNKPFPAWTVADWFQHGVRVYPYEWYLEQQAKAGPYRRVLDQMEMYRLPDGIVVFKWKDGEELPFEKIDFKRGSHHNQAGDDEGSRG